MPAVRCARCDQPATIHITGSGLPRGGVNTCPDHYETVLDQARPYPSARLIHDDGQDARFEMPGGDGD